MFLFYDNLFYFRGVRNKVLSILLLLTFFVVLLHDLIPHHHHESVTHNHVAKHEKQHGHDHDYCHDHSLPHSHGEKHDEDSNHKKDLSLFFFHKHSPVVINRFFVDFSDGQPEKENSSNIDFSVFSFIDTKQECLKPPDKTILARNDLPPPHNKVVLPFSLRGPPCALTC